MNNFDYYSMYREVNEFSSLNKLFAALLCEKINVMNYSTNTIIEKYYNLSSTLDELSYSLDESLEKVKNIIKIKKGYPIFKLDDLELTSPIQTHVSQDYKEGIIIENIKNEIGIILEIIKDIITKINNSGDYDTINILSNISYELKTLLLSI